MNLGLKNLFILFLFTGVSSKTFSNSYENATRNLAEGKTFNSIFVNKREGKSRYLSFWNTFWLEKSNIKLNEDFFAEFISHEQLCEENYIERLENSYQFKNNQIKKAVLSLRAENLIDDIAYSLIEPARKFPTNVTLDLNLENMKLLDEQYNQEMIEQALKQFSTYKKKRKCLKESFSQFYQSLTKSAKNKKRKLFKKTIKEIYRKKIISKENKNNLIALSSEDYLSSIQTLKSYKQTMDFISKNISDENQANENFNGLSDYISKKDKIHKIYPRQRLYANYNQFQIIYLSQILERFMQRLELTSTIGINLINDNDEVVETIVVDSPMEIYRFLVKYLRYEMSLLKENHLFSNTQVQYVDLVAASFEMYKVPPVAMEELLLMETIWNPQKTKKEKIVMWGKYFTQAGIIFIPPPYNYLASLSIMVIESFIKGTTQEATYDHSIFGEVN